MSELLTIKNKKKSRKPNFVRQDANKKVFKNKWRKPRGMHNKRRLKKKGHQKNPSLGYGSPQKVRYLHKSGLELIQISCLGDLSKIKDKNQAAVLSSKLGKKYKILILEKCIKDKIEVFNIKNIEEYITNAKDEVEKRKKEKKKREIKKKEAKEKAKEKAEEKKKESVEEKQEEIKEKVMDAKQEIKEIKQNEIPHKEQTKTKEGHKLSSVPGAKQ